MKETNVTCARLADSLDDILDGRQTAAWRTHLSSCTACRAAVSDARAIRAGARTLGPIEPPPQMWHRIERAIEADGPTASRSLWRWSTWQPLAAAAGLLLVVSSLVWLGARLGPATPGLIAVRTPAAGMVAAEAPAVSEFRLAEAQYTDAIARLEEATATAGPRLLDEATRVTLRSGIDDIDSAIFDAREALALEPDDELSQQNLLDALGSKVALLQDTVALLGEGHEPAEEQNP
jgi:hypothetical protein